MYATLPPVYVTLSRTKIKSARCNKSMCHVSPDSNSFANRRRPYAQFPVVVQRLGKTLNFFFDLLVADRQDLTLRLSRQFHLRFRRISNIAHATRGGGASELPNIPEQTVYTCPQIGGTREIWPLTCPRTTHEYGFVNKFGGVVPYPSWSSW